MCGGGSTNTMEFILIKLSHLISLQDYYKGDLQTYQISGSLTRGLQHAETLPVGSEGGSSPTLEDSVVRQMAKMSRDAGEMAIGCLSLKREDLSLDPQHLCGI